MERLVRELHYRVQLLRSPKVTNFWCELGVSTEQLVAWNRPNSFRLWCHRKGRRTRNSVTKRTFSAFAMSGFDSCAVATCQTCKPEENQGRKKTLYPSLSLSECWDFTSWSSRTSGSP